MCKSFPISLKLCDVFPVTPKRNAPAGELRPPTLHLPLPPGKLLTVLTACM